MTYSKSDSIRFWSKVNIRGLEECWEWTASLRNGYGQFYIDYRECRAHRVAFELSTNSEIPDDKLCLHKCDNPLCCNPDHLYLGSQRDNMRDKINRGRKPVISPIVYGSASVKLSEADIEKIRSLRARKGKALIAKEFNISRRTLYTVLSSKYLCKEGYYV